MNTELQRQLFHLLIGIVTIAMLLWLGRGYMVGAVFFVIIAGTLLINARMLGVRIGPVQWFEERFEREDVLFPGWGSACYAAGTLIPLTFLLDTSQIAACILVLALGDGMSTMVGRIGKSRLPYNRKKTLEGTAAFFMGSLAAFPFIGELAIPLALIAAIVESMDLKLDDNLTVPIACTIFFLVVG